MHIYSDAHIIDGAPLDVDDAATENRQEHRSFLQQYPFGEPDLEFDEGANAGAAHAQHDVVERGAEQEFPTMEFTLTAAAKCQRTIATALLSPTIAAS